MAGKQLTTSQTRFIVPGADCAVIQVRRMQKSASMRPARLMRAFQWLSIGGGAILLVIYVGARVDGSTANSAALREFASARVALGAGLDSLALPTEVDRSLWAAGRIAEYEESLEHHFDPPMAVLHIPKIGLDVAVLAGIEELVLNRAVGHVEGTALPGESGNIGLAGHRDGFFRGLKDLEVGDSLDLETLGGTTRFVIDDLRIVGPDEVGVLDPTTEPTLTLVTCYPFYFVGSAPQRYIVRAREESTDVR